MDNIRLGCALCRVLAHRLCNRIRGRQPPPPKPEHHVVCIGLECSGKSTALALLAGEPVDNIQPTNGFHIKDVILDDCMLNVKEIGGSEKIRKYWLHYYSGAQGVIFMVDGTTNVVELETARQAMINALSDSQLCFLPVLLLVTHQDKENCRSPEEIAQLWDVESVYKERIQVCGSSTKHLADLRAAFHSFSHVLVNGLPTAVDNVKLDMSDVRAMDLDDDDDVVVPS